MEQINTPKQMAQFLRRLRTERRKADKLKQLPDRWEKVLL